MEVDTKNDEIDRLKNRLLAAETMIAASLKLSRKISCIGTTDPEFFIDPQDLAEFDDAVHQWEECEE